jgi:branched-chain amino acid transport system permease protein
VFNHIGFKNALKTLIFGLLIMVLGNIFGAYNQSQLTVALIYFVGILSITLLTGISGQISLGQSALMAVGGYVTALLMVKNSMSAWWAIPLSVVASLLAGWILGITAARLSGPYLAGTTLVMALAIPSLAIRFESVFAGDVGLQINWPEPPRFLQSFFGELTIEKWQLFATLFWVLIALFLIMNIFHSRTGRAWKAIRDNEVAASLAGIHVQRVKVFVFVISSGFAGLAGALYGLRGIVGPSVFPISLSLALLTGAVIGGIRNIVGAGIGAIIVIFLPDWINKIAGSFELPQKITDYLPAMVGSLLLILTVVFSPNGAAGSLHRKRR